MNSAAAPTAHATQAPVTAARPRRTRWAAAAAGVGIVVTLGIGAHSVSASVPGTDGTRIAGGAHGAAPAHKAAVHLGPAVSFTRGPAGVIRHF